MPRMWNDAPVGTFSSAWRNIPYAYRWYKLVIIDIWRLCYSYDCFKNVL